MTATNSTINSILKDLTNVHENLMSLSDDIWNSIDHNNPEKLDEGYAFKKEFNRLLDIFNANSSEISALVSQFTGIKTESIPEEIKKENDENQRRVKELNKKTPHHISEDFTYKRPYAFIFDDCAYTQILTWNDIYIQFVSCLARKDSEKLKELADNSSFISKQNKKYYSSAAKDIRKPTKIMKDFYVETNLSAKDFMKRLQELLNYFCIPEDSVTIYLREDRNA